MRPGRAGAGVDGPVRLGRLGTGAEALLLQLVRGAPEGGLWPAAGDGRWEGALGLAERHGVAPLLQQWAATATAMGSVSVTATESVTNSVTHSVTAAARLPASVRARLKQARVAELRREQLREAVLQRALAALAGGTGEAPLAVLLLKGAASARTIYPAPELRPRGDLDLLVAPHDAAEARARLARWGFRHHPAVRGTPEDDPSWHEHTLHDPTAAEAVIDLHQGLLQPGRHGLAPGPLFSRGAAGAGLPGAALLPSAEDAVLTCALSLAAHELRSPLVVACDLARLLPRCDQRLLAERAKEARVVRALGLSLCWLLRLAGGAAPRAGMARSTERASGDAQAAQICGAPLEPPRLRSLLALLGLRRPTVLLLERIAARYDLRRLPLPRPEQLVRKALLLDRPVDAVRLAAATLERSLRRRLRGSPPSD